MSDPKKNPGKGQLGSPDVQGQGTTQNHEMGISRDSSRKKNRNTRTEAK